MKIDELPKSFRFKSIFGDGFTAEDKGATYTIKSDNGTEAPVAKVTVKANIEHGYWKVVDCQRTRKWVEEHTNINVNSVHAAAKFEVENNPYNNDHIERVIQQIHDLIDILLDKAVESWEYLYTGMGSYIVCFVPEGDECATIEVLVDPSIRQNSFYVNVKDYFNQV